LREFVDFATLFIGQQHTQDVASAVLFGFFWSSSHDHIMTSKIPSVKGKILFDNLQFYGYNNTINKLTAEKRSAVLRCLVEGSSIRSTCRMTGVSKKAATKLLVDLGAVCADYQDRTMRNLKLARLQCDEIWSFVGCKEKNVREAIRGKYGRGDVWTWTAIDAETKLIPCWHVGLRNALDADTFISDLADRLHGIPQVTTDGLKVYVSAIRQSFGEMVDYAMLIKLYGAPDPGDAARYSPSECIGIKKERIMGEPDMKHVCTSYVERQNLSMRMGMRRFTRLTNGFSKKVENHEAAVAVYFLHYNFCRIHQTIRVTPAMAAGLSDHVWEIEDVIAMLDAAERQAVADGDLKRGHYRPRNSK
jgi:IS1 family transposase